MTPNAPPPTSGLAAVVTTYKPDANFFARFAATMAFCERFIVVDNTPGGYRFPDHGTDHPLMILQDGQNKGLGRALNIGIEAARQAGVRAVILFDQDSSPSEGLLRDMLYALDAACGGDDARVCLGPFHLDDTVFTDAPSHIARDGVPPRLEPVTCLATSGMLFPIDVLGTNDLFTEDFFLDFVDFDWCWRLRRRHWKFYRAVDIAMHHRLGLAQRRFLGLTYHVPAPYRHYFQFRDTLRLTIRPYVPLYSKIRLAGVLPLKALAYPFLLDRRAERLRWMARGVADAFRRVRGVGAAGEILNR